MANWWNRAFNQSWKDDPFIIGMLKKATYGPRTAAAGVLAPAYELSNQLNRITDDDPETKWNWKPFGGQSPLGYLGKGLLHSATGGISSVAGSVLKELGIIDKDLSPSISYTNKGMDMALGQSFLDSGERQGFKEDPTHTMNKATGAIGTDLLRAGLPGISQLGIIPRTLSRFALGASEGALLNEKAKGEDPLWSSILGGAGNVVGGEIGDTIGGRLRAKKLIKDILNLDEDDAFDQIAQLPRKIKKSLTRQAKNSGAWIDKIPIEENLYTFLKNRALMGRTPAETLSKIGSSVAENKKLWKESLADTGKNLFENTKKRIKEELLKKGRSSEWIERSPKVKEIFNRLDDGFDSPEDAMAVIQHWEELGRKASGDPKTGILGDLYTVAAGVAKETFTSVSDQFDMAVQNLDNLFGLEKLPVGKAAEKTAKKGLNPLGRFSSGLKIGISPFAERYAKMTSGLAKLNEQGLGGEGFKNATSRLVQMLGVPAGVAMTPRQTNSQLSTSASEQPLGSQEDFTQGLPATQESFVSQAAQTTNPALADLQRNFGSPEQFMGGGIQGQQEGGGFDMQKLQMDLLQAVMSGQISPTQADYLMQSMQSVMGGQSITDQISELAQTDPQQAQQLLGQGVLSGQIDPTTAKTYASLLGLEGSGKITAGGKQAEADAQAALDQLDRLAETVDTQGNLFGPGRATIRTAVPLGGIETKKINAELYLAKQIIGKFLEGGVLRKEDEEKYRKILPMTTDQLPVAIEKIKDLKVELNNRLERYRQSGYAGYGTQGEQSVPDQYSDWEH